MPRPRHPSSGAGEVLVKEGGGGGGGGARFLVKVGGAGVGEAGGPQGRPPRLRVGSQGGMPTRSPPEAGLAGDESRNLPYPWVLSHFDASGAGKSTLTPWESRNLPGSPAPGVVTPYRRSRRTRCRIPPFA